MPASAQTNSTLHARVEAALDSIRDYIKMDGGDVRVAGIADGVVHIELLGNCTHCSMSDMTMKAGVEQAILRAVPEITAVHLAPKQ
jgi:Fe-S cluster biogenesis protein NfuA